MCQPEVFCKNSISACLEAVFLVQKMGNGKGNFNDEMMRHPAENGEPSVLQPALTTSFSHAFRIDLVMIMNNAFPIDLVMIINKAFRIDLVMIINVAFRI